MNSFKKQLQEKNEREFYNSFLDGDSTTSYIIEGLGEDIILTEYELRELIKKSLVKIELVDTYNEVSCIVLNNLAITIRIM